MATTAGPPHSDPLIERLERLAARQGRSQPARSLPPPVTGTFRAEGPPLAPTPGPPRKTPTEVSTRPSPPATARTRRRHPARGARIVALLASCATTGALASFFAGVDSSQATTSIPGLTSPIATTATTTATTTAAATVTAATAGTTASSVAADPAAAATTAEPATTAASTALLAFDGDTVQTRYGPVQVQAQVQNGVLVAVAVVQYPDDDGKSVRINERALPRLQSEALAAQSAQVDTVSGATYTSNAYVTSLQSAIDDARAAEALVA